MMPEIVKSHIRVGRHNRPGIKRTPRYIVIHDTANPRRGANAMMHARYLENTPEPVSWHYTVDDTTIVEHVPPDEVAYHAGDGRNGPGNKYGIGIEICENEDGDRAKAEDNAAWLVARLLQQYGWSLNHVRQHREFSPWGKYCPRQLIPRWGQFLDRVRHYLGQKEEAKAVARPVLRKGDRGSEVKQLQLLLQKLGYNPGPADGIYGPKTEAAVKAFQRDQRIAVDGIVGPVTWGRLDASLEEKQQPAPAPKQQANGKVFRVVIGSFQNRTGAEALAKRARAEGFEAWIMEG